MLERLMASWGALKWVLPSVLGVSHPVALKFKAVIFLSVLLFCAKKKQIFFKVRAGYLIYLVLVSAFVICYFLGYKHFVGPGGNLTVLEKMWWVRFIGLTGIACGGVLIVNSGDSALKYLSLLAIGIWGWAMYIVIGTVFLLPPPHYGLVIDALSGGTMNSPGISNLLILAPVGFCVALLMPKAWSGRVGFLGALGFATLTSIWGAVVLQQRGYFVATFVLCPTILGFCMILQRRFFWGVAALLFLGVYPLVLWVDRFLALGFFPRRVDAVLMGDPRFLMMREWWDMLMQNPWERATATATMKAFNVSWFHNFFADIQRLSGTMAMLLALLLCLYILFRIGSALNVDMSVALALFFFYVIAIAIMMTSVVPEGEVQFWVLLVTLGGLAERIHLGRKFYTPLVQAKVL